MDELFVKVNWPEIQDYQTEEYADRYEDEIDFSAETNCWFVPLSFYNEVNAKKTLIIDKDGPVKINDLISVGEQLGNGMIGGSTENTTWVLQ